MKADADGFAVFWAGHRDPLHRALVLVIGDVSLAAEATDEALARAWSSWPAVSSYADPAGWVYRVGKNWAISWRRKLSLRPTRPVEDLERSVADDADATAIRADTLGFLERLTREHREVLVLHHVLDWSVEEVAAALGVPVGTVKSRLSRARAAAAQLWEGDK